MWVDETDSTTKKTSLPDADYIHRFNSSVRTIVYWFDCSKLRIHDSIHFHCSNGADTNIFPNIFQLDYHLLTDLKTYSALWCAQFSCLRLLFCSSAYNESRKRQCRQFCLVIFSFFFFSFYFLMESHPSQLIKRNIRRRKNEKIFYTFLFWN